MRNWVVLLVIVPLIAVLAAGCVSTSASAPPLPDLNQEEWISKLLVGTWNGDIKDSRAYRMINSGAMLQIYEVHKEQNGWTVKATLNRQSLEYIELYVYNNTVMLKMMDYYGGLFTLEPYQNTHLLGNVIYDRGRWLTDPHDVVLKKISR